MALQITREYTTVDRYDVVVCGGGPAGTAAAISAARKGAKVLLIEQGGCLGGFWTRGLLTWLIDTEDKEGLINEVMCRLEKDADGLRVVSPKRFTADTEKMKLLFEQMCLDANVQILYHTMITDAVMDGNRIQYVLTESKSGHMAYGAKLFIDTTGDGDLGYFAGASFAFGNPNGDTQPMSLIGQFTGVSIQDMEPYDSRKGSGRKKAILDVLAEEGIEPSYKAPLIAVLSEEHEKYGLMINHEYLHGLSAENLTISTLTGRKEINEVVDALRKKDGIWKHIRLTATADMIGIREGRRIKGLYTVNGEDVNAGRCFDDGICTVRFGTDVHSLKPGESAFEATKYGNSHPPYQIPLRCLISAEIDNLLMGGRCISGDFIAHGSYRVAGNAFRTGEVAGLSAAYCVKNGLDPHELVESDAFMKTEV